MKDIFTPQSRKIKTELMAIPVDASKFYLMDLPVPAANAPELLQTKFGKKVNFA